MGRIHKVIENVLDRFGYKIQLKSKGDYFYWEDGLISVHNHDFMSDPSFCKAYQRGVLAVGEKGGGDYHNHWRVYIALWVALAASKLDGDFVECGVNYGSTSSSIMEYLHWNDLDKMFYLLDTFHGIDERQISTDDIKSGVLERNKQLLQSGFYANTFEPVQRNFSQWKNVKMIQGVVPDTLPAVESERVAYLHLDMNCSPPEVAALNFFWNRLSPGAFVLLDDYAYIGSESQKREMDIAAKKINAQVLSLPTGQGLIIKPFK